MKKLLVVAITALVATSAFAQKSMVRFYGWDGWDGGDRTSSFDFSNSSKEDAKESNIALNYAYAVTDAVQVGLTYKSFAEDDGTGTATAEDKATTTGISVYYNLAGKVNDTCYFAFHYNMTSVSDGSVNGLDKDDKQTDMVLEYGHRFAVGSAWGFNLAFAPSVAYTMSTITDDSADEDLTGSSLTWNFLKFDVLF